MHALGNSGILGNLIKLINTNSEQTAVIFKLALGFYWPGC